MAPQRGNDKKRIGQVKKKYTAGGWGRLAQWDNTRFITLFLSTDRGSNLVVHSEEFIPLMYNLEFSK